QGKPKGKIALPDIFETTIRLDVIKKAVIAQQSHRLQPQGRDLMAGKRTSAVSMGTGFHLARQPRVKGSGYPKAQKVAFAPNAKGGRTTHPPHADKRIYKLINKKERTLAICSAIAATANKDLVASRGHVIDSLLALPLIITDDIQEISKADEAKEVFEKLGLLPDLERVKNSLKIRAGKGTGRGRRRRHGVGPLFVIDEDKGVRKAMRNFLGVDVVKVNGINPELLAPGTNPGRLTIWTSSAIKKLETQYS
ncbi:50S ribosomal protein L4, partial [Candidatus Bathyarchaeota archaeon]|nr:50S ribosomal protein L4 [Candidatus Bathyarchaeota archaeon]